ncbi:MULTISPECIES: hypothetical protein [Bacillus]|uniref:hypothetical protein n=1 Tax=Bacillus TaxID=1386 RepID=UPI000C6E6614|nr:MULTISPECIES: hypothetical protein [Bacillus]AUG37185.1 hypothetical protein CXP43_16240 [Bacillus velezensis]MBL4957332.1 hypothetical protein [Bacillus velezensis]MCM3276324.1 hypothetical protein [Bacillus velezensis]MCM3350128.1 hypothetical protein [Bacillus velezensis]MCV4329276.1 hypothetical protein [Bacillus velezensis]
MKRRIRYVYTDAEWIRKTRITTAINYALMPIHLPLYAIYLIGLGADFLTEAIGGLVDKAVESIVFRKNRREERA